MAAARRHIVLVEACDGFTDLTSVDAGERDASVWLGLPVDEIAERLDCDITVIAWDDWRACAANPRSWLAWSYPATRPISWPAAHGRSRSSSRVTRIQLPARDPFSLKPLVDGTSAPAQGLLADSDPLFLASYCLNLELAAIHAQRPISLVILPMWGGLGYLPQMARATGAEPRVDVPVAVVVTDVSGRRQIANDEGFWMRAGIVRRQMEDLSLGLADLVLTFGPRGERIALDGRLPDSRGPIRVPRRVDAGTLDRLDHAADTPSRHTQMQVFLEEPQEAASGVLAVLDAAQLLSERGRALDLPIVASGPDMHFAPMQPTSFATYWASRGFVKELVDTFRWTWRERRPSFRDALPVRLYPSTFEHLPAVWDELARGSFVLLSSAAAEGLLPCGEPPAGVIIGDSASDVADALQRVADMPPERLDALRRLLCRTIVDAHRAPARDAMLDACARALDDALAAAPAPQDLGRVALLLTDRRRPLAATARGTSSDAARALGATPSLTVVVTCYDLGSTLRATLESVWASTRMPDQVLLVDDGSRQPGTLAEIDALLDLACQSHVPLRLIRQSNRGLSHARNAGLAHVTTDLVSFLDGDDLISPEYYALTTDLLRRYPRLGGVASWAHIFGNGVPDMFWNAPQPELPHLLVENTVVVPCVMRTTVVRELGGYDADQRYNYEDWELSIRLVAAGWPIVTIPAYLHRYRVRPESLLRSMTVAQHQTMRERLFARHTETASRFAVEIAMQLEHSRGRAQYGGRPADKPLGLVSRSFGRARRALAQRVSARLSARVVPNA